MDRQQYVRKRAGKYMAQVLEHFEQHIEPKLRDQPGLSDDFKALVRRRFYALSADAADVFSLEDEAFNAFAQEVRDSLDPVGRP